MRAASSNKNKHSNIHKMNAAMYRATEEDSSTEIQKVVNIQRIVRFMQVIYYKWLTSNVL